MSIPEYVEQYKNIGNGEHLEDVTVKLAGIEIRAFIYLVSIYHFSFGDFFLKIFFPMQGRIMSKRSSSSKLFFYDLLGAGAGTAKVQVMADARYLITVSFLFPYSYLIFHYDFSIVISLGMQCL